MEHVAVTGIGIVSPIGSGVEAFWQALIAGKHGFTRIPHSESLDGNRLWAAVPDDFLEDSTIERGALRNADRHTQYAVVAAAQAFASAGFARPPEKTAVIVGSTMGGLPTFAQTQMQFAGDPRHVTPKLMALVIPNMASSRISLNWGLHGRQLTISTACASSLDAIGLAARAIENGEIEYAVTGGTETLLTPLVYGSLTSARALSRNDDPNTTSRPFDVDRDGFVMGDGAALLFLERIERARERGARILARVRGYGSMTDAYHLTAPEPSGRYEADVIRAALDEAQRSVDVIFAHATGTVVGDAAEIRAINGVFEGKRPTVTGLRGHLGHAMAAAGASSAVAGILGMERDTVPQTLGTHNVEPEATFDVVIDAPKSLQFDAFCVNAFGFGGQNASIVLSR